MSNPNTSTEDEPHKRFAGHPLSAVLRLLAQDTSRERISIGDLLAALGKRALGALLFLFAVPNVFPTPPGTSTVLGAPLVFLAAQLMLGRAPWLPALVANRSISQADFATLVRRVAPWLERAEKLLRPRMSFLAQPPAEYAVGLVCFVLAVVLVLPIPFGNMLPAFAVCLLALGVLERDGLWVIFGLIATVASSVLVFGVVYGMVRAAILLLAAVFQ